MIQLLKIEWLKVKNYKAFLIISIFFVLGIFTTNYIVYSVFDNMVSKTNASILVNHFNPYDFDYVWQTASYTSGYILILPVLLLIILVTNEYTFRTNRQNIIDGWSRLQFVHVKMMMALIFAAVSALLVIITALVFGFNSGTEFSTSGISHLGYFFLKALSYNVIAVFLSIWIKKTGFAIGLFFIYLGAENIISQLLDFLSFKIRSNTKFDPGSMGDYLPMNASDGLLSFPDNPLKSMAKSALPTDYTPVVIGFAIFYLILFYWLGRRKLVKGDL
jgi:ABC-type transport system involved in multi-copper enzyme maturation permease subunit